MIKMPLVKIYQAIVNKNLHKLNMIYFETLKLKQILDH